MRLMLVLMVVSLVVVLLSFILLELQYIIDVVDSM